MTTFFVEWDLIARFDTIFLVIGPNLTDCPSPLYVDQEDAIKNASQDKILKCISSCKAKHDGPLTTKEELHNLVTNWEGTEKALHTSLNLEIRLRKLIFTKVKLTCPLFKQKN